MGKYTHCTIISLYAHKITPDLKTKKQGAVDFTQLFSSGMEFEHTRLKEGSVLLFPDEKPS